MPTLRLRPDFEDALRQVQGIRAASVVTRGDGTPTEIHVLAGTNRGPKQIVRDVQSLAMAQFDLDLDHRIVSVVQLDDADLGLTQPVAPEADASAAAPDSSVAHQPTTPATELDERPVAHDEAIEDDDLILDLRDREPVGLSVVGARADRAGANGAHGAGRNGQASTARVMLLPDTLAPASEDPAARPDSGGLETEAAAPRPAISSIMVRTSGVESEATVEIGADGHVFEGRIIGPAGKSHRPRLVAQATLMAVSELLGRSADVESVQVIEAGPRSVAVSVVTLHTPRVGEQAMSGSAVVKGDDADAIARSVLDALNRLFTG